MRKPTTMKVHAFFRKTPLIIRITVLYLVVGIGGAGALSLAPPPIPVEASYADENPAGLQEEALRVVSQAPAHVQGNPVLISVDRLEVELEVLPGNYDPDTKEWSLSNTQAFFATVSQEPGTRPGTTFIYGHNRAEAFGPLAGIRSGDTVVITLEDGTTLTYVYARDARVTPETVSVMYEQSNHPQLVLMTCEGLFSEVRRLMYFTLREVS